MKQATAFAINTGAQLAKMGCDAMHMKTTLMHTAEDKLAAAKRSVRKTWLTFSDYVDDVSVVVRRKPLRAIAVTSGVAFGAGALAGWLSRRK